MSRRTTTRRVPVFREVPPPAALAIHVDRTWVRITGDDRAELQPLIVPDGCIDIVWLGGDEPAIVGPATHSARPLLPPHSVSIGIRFRAGMAPSLLRVSAREILDTTLPLRAVWGRAASQIAEQGAERASVQEKVATLELAVIERLTGGGDGDRGVARAAAWLARHPAARVQEIAGTMGMSERQVRRRFEDAVGYGPKTLHRILRFQRWLRLARQTSAGSVRLAELASAAGYADQAHMTREVSRIGGTSPTSLLRELRGPVPMSDLFKTDIAPGVTLGSDNTEGRSTLNAQHT